MLELIAVPLATSRSRISAASPILFNPSSYEPYLAIPSSTLILTPPRLADVPARVSLLNAPSVSPYLFSPPNPYLETHARARTTESLAGADGFMRRWLESGKVDGCPFQAIRDVGPDGRETFVGELGVFRESTFIDVPEGAERDKVVETNLGRASGDPAIVWTMFFLLLPEFAGRGVMSQALAHLFEAFLVPSTLLNVRHIKSYAFVGNEGSRRVHEKLGFAVLGTDWLDMREDRGGGKREEWIFEWKK